MAMLKRQSILSFVFVRHPLDRLESAYYDKIVGKPSDTFYKMVKNIKAKCKILQMFSLLKSENFKIYISFISDHIESPNLSPEDFIKFVIDENRSHPNRHKVNEHWRPQVATCPFCLFKYVVYGRYETYSEDTAYILLKSKLVNLKAVNKMNGDVHHFEKKSQRRIEFWSAVPSNYIKDLKNVFMADFKLFDY